MDAAAREGLLGFLILFGVLGGATGLAFAFAALSAWAAKRRPVPTPQERAAVVAGWFEGAATPVSLFVEREETTLQWRWFARRIDGSTVAEIIYENDGTVWLEFADNVRERIENTVPPHRHSVWRNEAGLVCGEHKGPNPWRNAISTWIFPDESARECTVRPPEGGNWFPNRVEIVANSRAVGWVKRWQRVRYAALSDGFLNERELLAVCAIELRRFL